MSFLQMLKGMTGAGLSGVPQGAQGGMAGAGGSIPSSVLPGIVPGAQVGVQTGGGAGMFGGSPANMQNGLQVGAGDMQAPAITGGSAMFGGGSSVSQAQREQAIQSLLQNFAKQKADQANTYRGMVRMPGS